MSILTAAFYALRHCRLNPSRWLILFAYFRTPKSQL